MAKVWTKKLTELAVQIGEEIHTINNDGDPVSKDETLVRQVWLEALGHATMEDDPKNPGQKKEVHHKPQRWAKELLWSRREGGVPAAMPDDSGRMTAAEEVRALSTQRLNKLAKREDDNGE